MILEKAIIARNTSLLGKRFSMSQFHRYIKSTALSTGFLFANDIQKIDTIKEYLFLILFHSRLFSLSDDGAAMLPPHARQSFSAALHVDLPLLNLYSTKIIQASKMYLQWKILTYSRLTVQLSRNGIFV